MGSKKESKPDPEGQKRVRKVLGKKPSQETVRRAARDRDRDNRSNLRTARDELNRIKDGDVRPDASVDRRTNRRDR